MTQLFFKVLLQKNVFIYLDVTDYLKILDYFFSQRCSILFSFFVIIAKMIDH